MKLVDEILNKISMYRLVLYYLIILVVIASVYSLFGLLPFDFISFVISALFILALSYITNIIFSNTFYAVTNRESIFISSLILVLLLSPAKHLHDLIFLGWVSIWMTASKYIFAINKKHIFNPVAIAIVITAFGINQSATWWIGNLQMMPYVAIGGILIVKKIKRFGMVASFFGASILVTMMFSFLNGNNPILSIEKIIIYSPILFFAFVMLTEPLTMPPTKNLQIYYGILTGILFSPQIHIFSIYTTPELALVAGNLFSYMVSPKIKLFIKLKEKIQLSPNIFDFIFATEKKIDFIPGQYMEWTLGYRNPDARGNRRYFTIASSPTEDNIRIGIRYYDNPSSFKRKMFNLNNDEEICASQLAGDFVMPQNPKEKLVFIAGGIGITPFRSMIKYLLDSRQKRNIILFYANKDAGDIVYKDIFDRAEREMGIKTIYTLTGNNIPADWHGLTGRLNENIIIHNVPDYAERIYYLSGPPVMVDSFKDVLERMDMDKSQIKTDYFPGFA